MYEVYDASHGAARSNESDENVSQTDPIHRTMSILTLPDVEVKEFPMSATPESHTSTPPPDGSKRRI